MEVWVPAETESIADDHPFIAKLIMQLEQFFFLLKGPILAIEGRVEVIVVSEWMKCLPFATLLARPAWKTIVEGELFGYEAPFVEPGTLVEGFEGLVLLLGPWTLPTRFFAHFVRLLRKDYTAGKRDWCKGVEWKGRGMLARSLWGWEFDKKAKREAKVYFWLWWG